MVKIDNELILGYYFMGYEISSDSKPFPDWFEFHYEKISCLLGYNDKDMGVDRTKEEIVEEVLKLIK